MRKIVVCLFAILSVRAAAQNLGNGNQLRGNTTLFDARYVQTPPLYPFGVGSCKRFYMAHFTGWDSVLTHTIAQGDTAKYIRIYFSFSVDRYGATYNAHFEKIAATVLPTSKYARTIPYFFSNKKYYDALIKKMIAHMPFWKPALQNGIPVDCRVDDYFQFWVGIRSPVF